MGHGEFVWCDLSAHDAGPSRRFYEAVFGWSFGNAEAEYFTAILNGRPVAGQYQMPAQFITMGMPAFWMSYIAVDDVARTVDLAQTLGGKVEIGPSEFDGGGEFALIRDPLGAGFTVYSGPRVARMSKAHGARMGHGLFVSDAAKITDFYAQLFGWSMSAKRDGRHLVTTGEGFMFYIHDIPDPRIRGKEEYWAVIFAIGDVSKFGSRVHAAGGKTVATLALPEGDGALMCDPDGGSFVVVETRAAVPWLGWAGLGLIGLIVLGNTLWPWAIFFAVWVWAGLRSGETYLFERITRIDHPALYWILIVSYGLLGVVCLPFWGPLR